MEAISDWCLPLPATNDLLAPLLEVVPLQLLAFHIAILRGINVDQPRNLVKAVISE
jgi:glucosamine--fructose-6-phosphate aminotransferase (isomerizing)